MQKFQTKPVVVTAIVFDPTSPVDAVVSFLRSGGAAQVDLAAGQYAGDYIATIDGTRLSFTDGQVLLKGPHGFLSMDKAAFDEAYEALTEQVQVQSSAGVPADQQPATVAAPVAAAAPAVAAAPVVDASTPGFVPGPTPTFAAVPEDAQVLDVPPPVIPVAAPPPEPPAVPSPAEVEAKVPDPASLPQPPQVAAPEPPASVFGSSGVVPTT